MDNSEGEPTPIEIVVPQNSEMWEIPNMSGNWNCNVTRMDIYGVSSLKVSCYEDGKHKILFRLECSEFQRSNEVLIGFLDDSYQQSTSFSCKY